MAENTSHNTDVVAGSSPAPATKIGKPQLEGIISSIMKQPRTNAPISGIRTEVPICGVERHDEISGDWFSCGKDKGHKLDHGLWNKSERVD